MSPKIWKTSDLQLPEMINLTGIFDSPDKFIFQGRRGPCLSIRKTQYILVVTFNLWFESSSPGFCRYVSLQSSLMTECVFPPANNVSPRLLRATASSNSSWASVSFPGSVCLLNLQTVTVQATNSFPASEKIWKRLSSPSHISGQPYLTRRVMRGRVLTSVWVDTQKYKDRRKEGCECLQRSYT